MAVLVTGIAGFIGSHLGRQLLSDGHEVCAIVRPGTSLSRIDDYRERVRVIGADLARPESYAGALAEIRPELCFHVAWYAVHGRFWSAPENLDCVTMSIALMQTLSDAGCPRLVGVGTCAEYDWQHGLLQEDVTPCEPASLYGSAKHATHLLLEACGRESGVSTAWARLFFPYGPGEAETRLIPQTALALLRGERARCSHGRQRRDFIHVDDCAAALRAVAVSDLQGPVNIGTGESVAIASIVKLIARACGRSMEDVDLGAIPAPEGDPEEIVAHTDKLFASGWRPSRALEDGLAESVEWWRKRV